MVKRKRSTFKYVISALITFLVFGLGISLGTLLDNSRVKWLQEEEEQRGLNYESLQFQYLYLTILKDRKETCKVLQTTLKNSLEDLDITLKKLETYQKGTDTNQNEYERLQRKYILDNIEYWLFSKKAKQECNNVDLVTILYFYSSKHCPGCTEQGVVLTYYKKIFEERLLVFPIDMDVEEKEPMITILKSQYDIKDNTIPSIVIEEGVFKGVVGLGELKKVICSNFKKEQSECIAANFAK